MAMREITFILFLSGLSSLWVSTNGQVDCAANVGLCVDTAFEIFNNYADDIERVCQGTNNFLSCVVTETETCDPLVAASIKDSMSPMITMYTAEPYNCVLESATQKALQSDVCSKEMSACSVYYFQATAESAFDPNIACGLFEKYLACMQTNTTSCDGNLRDFIDEHTANATREFDQSPYYCEERINYKIDEVDRNMTVCGDIMASLDIRIIKQDYVCGFYRQYFNCAIGVLSQASPRQFEEYLVGVNEISLTFRAQPYFCESDDPCMDLFRTCNASAQNPGMGPCQLMDVYTTCLSNGLSACAEDDYTRVASDVQQLMGDIHNKYNCIEENKDKQFDELTTPPEMEPTTMKANDDQEGGSNSPGNENTNRQEEPPSASEDNNNDDDDNNSADTPATSHKDNNEEKKNGEGAAEGGKTEDNARESNGENGANGTSHDGNGDHVTTSVSGSDKNPDAGSDVGGSEPGSSVGQRPDEESNGPRSGGDGGGGGANGKGGDSNASGRGDNNINNNNNNRASAKSQSDNGAGLLQPSRNWGVVLLCFLSLIRAVMT